MKLTGNWLAMCGMVALFLASCFDPPQYGPIPEIEFDKIIFKDVSDPSSVDSLIISLKFKDGDGDLGLDASELIAPYNNKYYFKFSDNTFVTYKTKRTNPRYDTLPTFVKPYNCINWEIKTVNNKIDTFYFQLNPNHYNIFIDFFVQNNDGSFKEFDWQKEFTYPNCGIPFDGRFPLLSKDLSQKTPLDGTIRYAMQSTGFLFLFSIKTLKLRVTIQDRALNKSNTIETPLFTLGGITVKSG